jgi:HlyD family secretion protein
MTCPSAPRAMSVASQRCWRKRAIASTKARYWRGSIPSPASRSVDSAEASLAEAQANAAVARAEWKRAEQGPDLFSQEEDDRRHTTAIAADAKVRAAEAQVADMRNRLAHTTVIAPTDGIVLTRTAEIGQIAVPGTTVLFRLARDGQVEMRGQVAEQDLPKLKIGQIRRRFGWTDVAKSFTGEVWQVGAIIDPTTRQGSVRIALPSDNARICVPGPSRVRSCVWTA